MIVASEDQEIVDDVKKQWSSHINKKEHKTGTDRIYEALEEINSSNVDLVMNLQGDEPLMEIDDIRHLNDQMIKNNTKLGTLF